MSYFDIIFLIFLVWSGYKGFVKGFIKSLASLAALVLGIYGAIHFSGWSAALISHHFNINAEILPLIAFAATFILIIIGIHLLAGLLDKLMKSIALGFINQIAGLLFGILKAGFILSIILVLINKINEHYPFIPEEQKEQSYLYVPLSSLAPTIFPYLHFDKIRDQFKIDAGDENKKEERPTKNI